MEPVCANNSRDDESQSEQDRKWVYDSSVDYKGNIALRSSTGAWKAAFLIIVMEFSERLSYAGLSTNLVIYLTRVLHQEVQIAARNVNYWQGVATLMPLLGGFLADAYFGRFSMVFYSSLVYLMGLILLVLSQLVPSLKPCQDDSCHRSIRVHEAIFFIGMYLISVGIGGIKPSLQSFGADQFDDGDAIERKQKMSYFNWWNCTFSSALILATTVIAYIEDKVSLGVACIVLLCLMGSSLAAFLAGRRFYRCRVPEGSPFTPMLQVAVAAMSKRHLPHPSDANQLYEVSNSKNINKSFLCHSRQFRFLDKAAIIQNEDNEEAYTSEKLDAWRLATVTRVEETKLILSMIPIWLACLPFGISTAQVSTFFIKQGSVMNRKLSNQFEIPPASTFTFAAIGTIATIICYDKLLVPFLRRMTGCERGISILKRIGIGMTFATISMVIAASVERNRLNNLPSPTSVFWLIPQFAIMGVGDGFAFVGLQEYFYDQVPDSMRSLGIALYLSVLGVANFLSSFLITIVDHITRSGGRRSWFTKDMNANRIDLFYGLIAGINGINLFWYVYLARRYSYKSVRARVATHISSEEGIKSNFN